MPERPAIPPPGVPVRSFNAPPHIEAAFVERVDITATGYSPVARGTLYNTITGADQRVVDNNPNIFLLREIIDPGNFPWSYRYWGLAEEFTNKSIGQDNLIPPKYRRLITRAEKFKPIDIGATFPSVLTGDQTLYEHIQETIYEARRHIVEETINVGSSLVGHETDEQGILTVTESIVDDGTSVDSGYLVKSSTVTPLGNGKSIKITISYISFPDLYDYDIDEETGQTVLIVFRIVDASIDYVATMEDGIVVTYKHIDKWRTLRITKEYSTPAMYEEQRFGAMNFPTLFDGVYYWTAECGAFAAGLRGGFSAMVPHRIEISFDTTKPATIDGLTLIPKTLLMGKGVQLPPDLIVDSNTISFFGTSCSSITPLMFDGSDPDYSTYVGSIQNTEQLITGEAVRMGKGGFYKITKVYVTMK